MRDNWLFLSRTVMQPLLLNPLVYLSEGVRMALTSDLPHMNGLAIYAATIGFTVVLLRLGIAGFRKQVLT